MAPNKLKYFSPTDERKYLREREKVLKLGKETKVLLKQQTNLDNYEKALAKVVEQVRLAFVKVHLFNCKGILKWYNKLHDSLIRIPF